MQLHETTVLPLTQISAVLERMLKVLENATFSHKINQKRLFKETHLVPALLALIEVPGLGTDTSYARKARCLRMLTLPRLFRYGIWPALRFGSCPWRHAPAGQHDE